MNIQDFLRFPGPLWTPRLLEKDVAQFFMTSKKMLLLADQIRARPDQFDRRLGYLADCYLRQGDGGTKTRFLFPTLAF